MGRGKRQATAKKSKAGGSEGTYTPEMLIEQGNVALGSMELELAAEFFSRALSLSKDDTNIMDALADVKLQLGETDKALELLLKSTSSAPTVNPLKWFFLGQLQTESDSVKSYRMGIQILTEVVKSEADADARAMLTKQIAKAHCSIAEIYLTDLCFEEDAERVCEEAVAAAQQICPNSLDAQQTLASLRISQNRKGEAGDIISAVCDQVMRIRSVVAARTVVEEMSGAAEPAEFQDLPELTFCMATMKLLIECAGDPRHAHLYARAQELGSSLLEEEDEIIELWYLMGLAFMGGVDACTSSAASAGPAGKKGGKKGAKATGTDAVQVAEEGDGLDLAAAQFHFETALELMSKLREEQRQQQGDAAEFDYQQQWDLVQEHLRLIATAGKASGSGAGAGAASAKVQVPVDEEWSDDGEMAVDK